jgi:regulator of replication initiation timing
MRPFLIPKRGGVMNEKETAKRLHLLEKEIGVLVEDLDGCKLDLRSQLDDLRLEVETLKDFLQQQFPAFPDSYRNIKYRTCQEKNPEWM